MTRTRLLALAVTALTLALAAPASALEQKLTAAGDLLGYSAAVDGDTLVLGELTDNEGAGAVYVFRRTGDTWTNTAKLTASDGAKGEFLGTAVAIEGDTIVAAARLAGGTGAVYTFTRTGAAERTETAKLTASDADEGDQFGSSVAIDGDTIVAGAPFATVDMDANGGSLYTFARTGAAKRTETAKLTVPSGSSGDNLGFSVALDGDTIVAGAPSVKLGDNAKQGAVYTFTRTGAAERTETAELTAKDGAANDNLGYSVGIEGDTIVAGAPDALLNVGPGTVYTFARTGAVARTETAKLTASDRAARDALGYAVAIDGGTIVASAPGDTVGGNTRQGSVYTFASAGAPSRKQTGKLSDAEGEEEDLFGISVALDGDAIVAGAPLKSFASVFFAPAPPPPPPPPPVVKPVLSKLAVSAKGTRISFTLSEAASVKLGFAKAKPGRKVGRHCVTLSRANRAKRHCPRFVTVGSFTVAGKPGRNTISLTGALSLRKRLAHGSYRLTARPTDGEGLAGSARSARFAIPVKAR